MAGRVPGKNKAMKTKASQIVQVLDFKRNHPVRRAFHSGKYGWRRYLDGLDLTRCSFATRKAAEMDRAAAAHAELTLET